MNWIDYDTNIPIIDITQFDDSVIGFIYLIHYADGTSYVGKKNLYSYKTVHRLKNGDWPKGIIEVKTKLKNTGKGKRLTQYIAKIESNWKKYKGSHEQCKSKEPIQKFILDYATTKLELTYLEAKYMFKFEVLEHDSFLNDNILGAFYKAHLYKKDPVE